jgi:hypothetical protein
VPVSTEVSGFEAADQPPNAPHEPSVSVAPWRSITFDVASMPEPPSVPLSSVSPTEAALYHGPAVRAADCPEGAIRSIVTLLTSLCSMKFMSCTVALRARLPSGSDDSVQEVE